MAITIGKLREERIRTEYNRLKRLLKPLSKDKMAAAKGLIERVSFMAITLEDLEVDINAMGTVETFTQGDNTYDRQRPCIQIYNTTVKNYTTACKQLTDLVPANGPPPPGEPDPFDKIMNRKK